MTVSIQRQAERVELELMGARARLDEVRADKRWPPHDLEQKRVAIEELEAATATMQAVAAHADVVREAIRKARGQ